MWLKQSANFVYIAAALVLAGFAARASSLTILTIVSACFVAVALGMAFLQWKDELAEPPGGSTRFGLAIIAAAVVLIVLSGITRLDALPVFAATAFYLGAGWLVLGLRNSGFGGRKSRSPVLLGLGVVLFVVGLLILPSATLLAAIFLALSVAVLLPIGLNLASEDVVPVRQVLTPKQRLLSAVAGVVVAALVAVFAALFSHSTTLVLVVSIIAVLAVWSIVSRTHLDTALALTVVAFISAAPLETASSAVPKDGYGDHALIALGDSYMSGEGLSTFYSGTDDAGGNECRRSPYAYAAKTGTDRRYFDGLTFLACSGATASNVLRTPAGEAPDEQYPGQRTQLDELTDILQKNPSFRPSLVLVGIGGNDAGFARIGEACIAPGNCSEQSAAFLDRLDAVEQNIELVYREVHELLPHTTVVAVPYPQPIKRTVRCGQIALGLAERTFIATFLDRLDVRVEQAAKATGTVYLASMKNALAAANLQLCDTSNGNHPGLNFVKLSGQGAAIGAAGNRFNPAEWIHDSLHPNVRGHEAMTRIFEAWLDANPTLRTTAAFSVGTITAVPHGVDTRTIDLAAVRTWELDQVRDLTGWFVALLIGLAGLWVTVRALWPAATPDP